MILGPGNPDGYDPESECRFNDDCGPGYICKVTISRATGQMTGKCKPTPQCYTDAHCKFQDPRPGLSKLGPRGPGHICKKSSGECVPPPPALSYFANGEKLKLIVSFRAFDNMILGPGNPNWYDPESECTFGDDCSSRPGFVCEVHINVSGNGKLMGKCIPKCSTNMQCKAGYICTMSGFCTPPRRQCLIDEHCREPGHICKEPFGQCVPPSWYKK